MTTQEEITTALVENAEQRKISERRLRRLRNEADALVVAGDMAGIPKLRLAKAAGLTRQTVYSVILRAKVPA